MSAAFSRSIPPSIGRYRIEALIGKGGMGEVFRAFDPSLDRTIALKTIAPDADNPLFLERLYREARACGRLRHPAIVTVHDLGEVDGVVFIAMEYLEGQNLAAAINDGQLSFEHKIRILIQILDALGYAHNEGVIHRDIKPSNVHLLRDGSVKLLDFGLARVTRAESLTVTGSVMGTPYYMSPEQLKGQKVDGRTDVYSTGALAYELLTRRHAFEGENITTVMLKVLSDTPPPMETAWSHAFPEIEQIVTRAIAKSVDDRFQTADEMKTALAAFLRSSHAAIAQTEVDMTRESARAVTDATTMLANGRAAESQALLEQTIRANPDSAEARTLLRQVTQRAEGHLTPEATVPDTTRRAGGPAPVVIPVPVVVAAPAELPPPVGAPVRSASPAPQQPSPPPLRAAGPVYTPSPRPVMPSPVHRRRWIWGAAALLVLLASVLTLRARRDPPQDFAAPPGAIEVVKDPPAQPPAPPPTPPPATPNPDPVAAIPTPPATGGGPESLRGATNGTTQRVVAQPRQPAATNRSVYIDAGRMDRALAIALEAALKSRGLTIGTSSSGTRLTVAATADINVRKAVFENGVTADYVGTLTMRTPGAGGRETAQFDGHALEFGEANVRAAAIRALADKMAEAIENAVGTPPKE